MIAVTGAAGFIGSNLAHRLTDMGKDLLLVDHPLTADKARNLVGLAHYTFMEHERFLAFLERDQPQLEGIFHLGACSRTTETDWSYLERNNIGYSQRLWSWCAGQGAPLIYASSAATYGDGSMGFDDTTPPEKLKPLNLYGKSKNDFDAWALGQVGTGQPTPAGWAGLKFFNVYGPREIHKEGMASIVWQAWKQIRQSGEMRLFRSNDRNYADGEQLRDFVFVGDCIDHLLWLWQHPEASGIYNSGTGNVQTFIQLTEAVFQALGQTAAIRFIDMPASLAGQYQNFTQANMRKLRQAGFASPLTSLQAGVQTTIDWLKTQQIPGV